MAMWPSSVSSFFALLLCLAPSLAFSCGLDGVQNFSAAEALPSDLRQIVERSSDVGSVPHLLEEIGPPPRHGSRLHCLELHDLRSRKRSAEVIDAAKCEEHLDCWTLGDYQVGAASSMKFKYTRLLIQASLWHLDQKVFLLKSKIDRARPTQAFENFEAAISVPKHPSYPSGHAAQARLIAMILSLLNSTDSDRYHEDALRIAKNREIVGVHYPSDTVAGFRLAEAMFAEFDSWSWFQHLLTKSMREWPS